jgi:hypothetical protein
MRVDAAVDALDHPGVLVAQQAGDVRGGHTPWWRHQVA